MQPRQAALRVGMTEAELRAVNQIPQRMVIKAGSTLLVPRAAGMQTDVAVQVAEQGQLALAREVSARRSVLKAGKHDTVASVAARYHVSAAEVAQWNKVALTAAFKPGQSVVLFTTAPAKALGKTSTRKVAKAGSRKRSGKAVKVARAAAK